ncbi:MAG: hypothetical protein ACTSP9_19200, partial [Promethearchaeota archaeon]
MTDLVNISRIAEIIGGSRQIQNYVMSINHRWEQTNPKLCHVDVVASSLQDVWYLKHPISSSLFFLTFLIKKST